MFSSNPFEMWRHLVDAMKGKATRSFPKIEKESENLLNPAEPLGFFLLPSLRVKCPFSRVWAQTWWPGGKTALMVIENCLYYGQQTIRIWTFPVGRWSRQVKFPPFFSGSYPRIILVHIRHPFKTHTLFIGQKNILLGQWDSFMRQPKSEIYH